jgi:hypothetical protein
MEEFSQRVVLWSQNFKNLLNTSLFIMTGNNEKI